MADDLHANEREPDEADATREDAPNGRVRYVRVDERPTIGQRISAKWRNFVDTSADGSIVWLCKRIAQWAGVFWRAITRGLNKGLDRVAGREDES